MEATEDEIFEKYAEVSLHCMRNTHLPCEYKYACVACRYGVMK